MTETFSDLGVTVPQSMKDLILLAAKVQGVPVTVIVRMALKREETFLMSLACLEETSIPEVADVTK